jgi:hypothetical protein
MVLVTLKSLTAPQTPRAVDLPAQVAALAIIKEVRQFIYPLLIASLLLGACKKDIQNEDAVKQGILNYLSKRQDLGKMDVTVSKVAFRQNEADATVHFQAKDSNASNTGIDFQYVLERKGNEWVVKGKAMGSGHGAGGGAESPHGMGGPAGGGMPAPMPPGHPTVPPAGRHGTSPPLGPGK